MQPPTCWPTLTRADAAPASAGVIPVVTVAMDAETTIPARRHSSGAPPSAPKADRAPLPDLAGQPIAACSAGLRRRVPMVAIESAAYVRND